MRQRLERQPFDYQVLRSNDAWTEHRARSLVTAGLIAWLRPETVLDPACGDASIVIAANRLRPIRMASFADISEANIAQLQERIREDDEIPSSWGAEAVPIDFALDQPWHHDVIVLTEILEHLPDPDAILRKAREKGTRLISSSPLMRSGQIDTNPEHLWMFDRDGYGEMLANAGFRLQQFTFLQFPTMYDFGIWVCS